jgi:XTP/dITP diphosphohydrolase
MRRLVVATHNPGKQREIEARLKALDCKVLALADIGEPIEIVEDASTFEGNALKKARAVANATGLPALADDSGLEVEALGNKPGVHSARYGGPELDDRGRCAHLLRALAHVPPRDRTARFRAVLVYLEPGSGSKPRMFNGVVDGRIGLEQKGEHGFGYDPVFVPNGYREPMAVLGPEIKARISHRAQALDAFVRFYESLALS